MRYFVAMRIGLFTFIFILTSCRSTPVVMSAPEFRQLMNGLAEAWSTQDTDKALACFDQDAIYMEPPDIQYYRGQAQLRPYFAALEPGTSMTFHNLWLDEKTGFGAGEFTFGMKGRPQATVGVVVVQIKDGRIAWWREYQRKGPADFKEFLSSEGKVWKWHIGNYP